MSNTLRISYPGTDSAKSGGQTIYNSLTPFQQDIGSLKPGKLIFINGLQNVDRFTLNFKKGEVIAFHFDIRDKGIVANAHIGGKWGREEKAFPRPFPFGRDKYFEILVLVEQDEYKVAVNNEHLMGFKHRVTLETVHMLEVKGDVRIFGVKIQE